MEKSEFSRFYWKIGKMYRKLVDLTELVKSTKKMMLSK